MLDLAKLKRHQAEMLQAELVKILPTREMEFLALKKFLQQEYDLSVFEKES